MDYGFIIKRSEVRILDPPVILVVDNNSQSFHSLLHLTYWHLKCFFTMVAVTPNCFVSPYGCNTIPFHYSHAINIRKKLLPSQRWSDLHISLHVASRGTNVGASYTANWVRCICGLWCAFWLHLHAEPVGCFQGSLGSFGCFDNRIGCDWNWSQPSFSKSRCAARVAFLWMLL